MFGTKRNFAHSLELYCHSLGGGAREIRIMNDKTGKKTKTSAAQQVVKEAVSSKLKAYYDDISRQDVPQRFLDLLEDLDKANERSE
jgi:hypothetical protein